MSQKKQSQLSDLKHLLIQIQIALKESRLEDALKMLNQIDLRVMASLSIEELQILGKLIHYIKEIAEEKRANLLNELNKIIAAKRYLS
ncbi:MAG: hypothetical protein NZ809_01280 [Thermodesulfovibrio sp.]|nr:hypothetical protein [Thermodesulfovibrio sp.]